MLVYSLLVSLLAAQKVKLGGAILGSLVFALIVDPTVIAAAVVTVVTALTGSVVIIINALGNAKKELLVQTARVSAQADVITAHVNGMTTAAAAKRTADDETITSLRQQLAKAEERAVLLAQAVAIQAIPAVSPTVTIPT